ncbi:MAG: nucleotidyltransferase family protein [Rhodobacteraceae bacterium]|nr:nucleotidyltransferase family protein [Paracoccaceae bacterium]
MGLDRARIGWVARRDCAAEADWLAGCVAGAPRAPARRLDPRALFEVARLSGLVLCLPSDPAQLPEGCGVLAAEVDRTRLRVLALNRAVLRLAAEAGALLGAEGIAHVHLKGPLAQAQLYGDTLRRPSADADILVARADRRRAAAALAGAGFVPTEAALAGWWTRFLGEQHLRRPGAAVFVDLHHALQQPGLPRPRGEAGFLARAERFRFEGTDYPVLSAADRCLLGAMGLVRALLARAPAGGLATDLAAGLAALTPDGRRALDRIAADSGLAPTLSLGAAAAAAVVPGQAGGAGTGAVPHPLGTLGGAELRAMVLTPWREDLPWPRRRTMLRALCGPDPLRFAAEAGRAALSSAYRGLLEVRAGLRGPAARAGR